jgi:hypothetical protein
MSNCSQLDRRHQIMAQAKMIWTPEQEKRSNRKAGICQFCSSQIGISHRVIKDGKTIECATGSAASTKAQGQLEAGARGFDLMVFPVSSCEVMCNPDEYEAAEMLVKQCRKQWESEDEEKRKQSQINARKAEDDSIPPSSSF